MTPDTRGRLTAGSSISITLQCLDADAHVASTRATHAHLWDQRETLNVTMTGRDSFTLSGYDGAYLMGSSWAV